jgi:NAD(P)H-hydrate epimerase
MEKILTNEQMRLSDRYTIDTLGIPDKVLVERAGKAVADEITSRFTNGSVLVCVGKGNNGADGTVIAELLSKKGFLVSVVYVYNGDLDLFNNQYDIIVDCIFGTGLNREVTGVYKNAIEKINSQNSFVVSCDIPSGLNGDTGLVMGVSVKADITVAIQEYKLGHFLNDGPDFCGKIIKKDIGISISQNDYAKKLNDEFVKKYFPARKRNSHKGYFGKACIFGGSKRFSGSVLLSLNALSALKIGVGYSNLAIPNSLYSAYLGVVPECTFTPVKDCDGEVVFDKNSLDKILCYDSIAMGMGIGVSENVYEILKYILLNYTGKLVIDADGLNTLSTYGVEILKQKKCSVVLTPHIGEFSRLIKTEKGLIMSDIIGLSKEFASRFGVVLLVKSATSVITDGKNVIINTTGSPCMAKGGSGDVLSGIIAGLLARLDNVFETTAVGSYIFGRAGEIAEKEQNEYSVTATDIIGCLSKTINALKSND